MQITNIETVPGKKVVEHFGLVSGSTIRAKHIGRDFMAGLKNLVGGELKGYTQLLQESRQQAMDRMIEEARLMGANAILNVRFSTSSVAQGAADPVAGERVVQVVRDLAERHVDQEERGHDDLADQDRHHRVAGRREIAVTIGREAPDLEAGLATRDQVEHAAGRDPAQHLGHDVGQQVLRPEPAAGPQADRHGGIEVAARDVADRVRHGHHRQAEGEGHTEEADPELRKRGREDGAASGRDLDCLV